MPSDSAAITAPSPTTRSRLGNGSVLGQGVDGRRAEARRWRDCYLDLAAALEHEPSIAEQALLRRAASLMVAAEQFDADLAAGRAIDADELVRLSNALGRALASLGLARWADTAPPSPGKPDPDAALERVRNWGKAS